MQSIQKRVLKAIQEHPGCTPHDIAARLDIPLRNVYGCIYRIRQRLNIDLKMIDGGYVLPEGVSIERKPVSERTGTIEGTKGGGILKDLMGHPEGLTAVQLSEKHGLTRGSVTAHISILRHAGHIIDCEKGKYIHKGKKKPKTVPGKLEKTVLSVGQGNEKMTSQDGIVWTGSQENSEDVIIIKKDRVREIMGNFSEAVKAEVELLIAKAETINRIAREWNSLTTLIKEI